MTDTKELIELLREGGLVGMLEEKSEKQRSPFHYKALVTHALAELLRRTEPKPDMRDNEIELLQEDLDCVHHYLDDMAAPIVDVDGERYSIVGRIKALLRQELWAERAEAESSTGDGWVGESTANSDPMTVLAQTKGDSSTGRARSVCRDVGSNPTPPTSPDDTERAGHWSDDKTYEEAGGFDPEDARRWARAPLNNHADPMELREELMENSQLLLKACDEIDRLREETQQLADELNVLGLNRGKGHDYGSRLIKCMAERYGARWAADELQKRVERAEAAERKLEAQYTRLLQWEDRALKAETTEQEYLSCIQYNESVLAEALGQMPGSALDGTASKAAIRLKKAEAEAKRLREAIERHREVFHRRRWGVPCWEPDKELHEALAEGGKDGE